MILCILGMDEKNLITIYMGELDSKIKHFFNDLDNLQEKDIEREIYKIFNNVEYKFNNILYTLKKYIECKINTIRNIFYRFKCKFNNMLRTLKKYLEYKINTMLNVFNC